MVNCDNQTSTLQVLSMIEKMVKNLGSEKNIVSTKLTEELVNTFEQENEKEIMDSVLQHLEDINEKMENMSWLNKHHKILHDFAQTCSKTLNEEVLYKKAYELVSQVMPTDSFFIVSHNDGDSHIQFRFIFDAGEHFPPTSMVFGNNFSSKAIQTRQIIHHKNKNHGKEYKVLIGKAVTVSHLFVPIIIDDQVKGVISAQSFDDFAYRTEHEELLRMIGTQVLNSVETARLYEKIYLLSETDDLTGLKNYRAFHKDLEKLIKENEQDLTLVMIDSDDLKKVNDQFGHDAGDNYLKVLADGIKSISTDNIAGYRYAGDEFMIIMKSNEKAEIQKKYQELLTYFYENPVNVQDEQFNLSFSAGVAFYPEQGTTVDTLKKSVDQALYEAKNRGKNRMVFAN